MCAWTVVRGAAAQGSIHDVEADVDKLARRVRPAMVTVIAQRMVDHRVPGKPASERRLHTRVGSGVAVESGAIITTASVVLSSSRILVLTEAGAQVEGQLVGMDPIFNVALVRVPGLSLAPVRLSGRAAQNGDWAMVLGSSYRAQPTQSVGRVAFRFAEPRMSLLQLTNEVYPGNSGGAAFDSRGELIGLVQGELGTPESPGRSEGERRPGGMSFVLPSEHIRPVVESLAREGRVRHGMLGVSTRGAYVESESQKGLRVPIGALVEAVSAGGPAERAGLRKGDLIVAYENERVEYSDQLARWVASTSPGSTVDLVWVRDEQRVTGRAVLATSPTSVPAWMQARGDATHEPVSSARASELRQEIRRLSRELESLQSGSDSSRR